MKKILMLLQSEFPPDIRLEKEIRSLSQNGFRVILLCNQFNKENNKSFLNCEIHRIKALSNSKKVNKILNFPIFFNPRFIIKGILLCKKYSPDFIHAHDLPMVPLGILLGKLFNKKVIFDMHENYPQALKFFKKKGLHNLIFKNYYLARLLEKLVLSCVDRIIVVVSENRERLIRQKIKPERIVVISNTVDISTFNIKITDAKVAKSYERKFVIAYSGGVSQDRGLDVPVKAIKYLIELIPNILMLIIGDGPSIPSLKNLSNKYNIKNYIEFVKWPGHNNIFNYLSQASILIIPQPNNEFINTTIPHKLFEYMYIGKPILVSDALPLKRIVDETNCGIVFRSNDPLDFADKVVELMRKPGNLGKNGRAAVKGKYNWDFEGKKLIKMYERLN